jgi:hypothetical protein
MWESIIKSSYFLIYVSEYFQFSTMKHLLNIFKNTVILFWNYTSHYAPDIPFMRFDFLHLKDTAPDVRKHKDNMVWSQFSRDTPVKRQEFIICKWQNCKKK